MQMDGIRMLQQIFMMLMQLCYNFVFWESYTLTLFQLQPPMQPNKSRLSLEVEFGERIHSEETSIMGIEDRISYTTEQVKLKFIEMGGKNREDKMVGSKERENSISIQYCVTNLASIQAFSNKTHKKYKEKEEILKYLN